MLEAVVGVALRAILASVLLGGVLAALVLAATRTLSLTAATRHALWTTALIATALMPLAGVGVSVSRATVATAPAPSHMMPALSDITLSPPAARAGTFVIVDDAAQSAVAAKPPPRGSFGERIALADRLAFAAWTPRVSRALALGVVAVWALGALIGLIGLALSVARVRGLRRRSSPLDGTLADELPWLTEAGPGREIYLRLSYETETPVAIGFRRPVILIPTELATAEGLTAIEPLILHEHAHLRRNDDWTNLLQRTVERVFWFNPIVWFVGRRIALEREIASDDAVVEKTGEAHAYATSLWKLAREMRMPEHAVVAPGALLTRKQITVRIEQLLDKKRARLHRSPAAALGVALAGVLSIAFVATSAPGVELRADAAPEATAAAGNTVPTTHSPRRHSTIAQHGVAAKRSPAGAAAFAAEIEAQNALRAALKKRAAGTDGPTRAMQAQLQLLRAQLAAAQRSAAAAQHPAQHRKTLRIAERAAGDAAVPAPPSTSRELSAAWRDVSAVPPVPALPPLPVIVPKAPAMSSSALARVQALTAAASARARERVGVKFDADIERTISRAIATIPHEIALEFSNGNGRRMRYDGAKLTRAIVMSCPACSFRNADARGLDLHDLKLNADNFAGADMRGVNLSGAKLSGVSLAGANLSAADLRGAQLTGVQLQGANFDGALLEGVRLTGASIRRMNVHGSALRNVVANCVGCEFAGIDLHGQDLHGLTVTGADFSRADLHDANLSGVHFVGVDLSHANLSGADLTNAHLETCDLDGADMRGARTTGMTTAGDG